MLLTANHHPPYVYRRAITKTLLVMRLTSIFLLAFALHVSANTNAQRITLSLEHVPLKKVFEKITDQTGIQFVYRDEWLSQAKPVNITVKDASLQEAIDICFSDQPFTYEIIDKLVVMKRRDIPLPLPAADFPPPVLIDVHGRVTDFNGKPLVGVTIVVRLAEMATGGAVKVLSIVKSHNDTVRAVPSKLVPVKAAPLASIMQSTSVTPEQLKKAAESAKPAKVAAAASTADSGKATPVQTPPVERSQTLTQSSNVLAVVVTDGNGEFLLKQVPEDALLNFSHVGYELLQLKLNKRTELSIRLSLKVVALEDIKVTYSTGYQVRLKERATGSFGKPDMDVFEHRDGTMDVVTRLEGLVPGVTVLGSSANPGGTGGATNDGTQKGAIVRGASSVGLSTSPLYVVNGVIVPDFNSINVDDIADITVLKDAAASAIWGAKAANGVIVVNTKEGERGQKIKFNYNGFINYQGRPDLNYLKQLNSSQYVQAAKETFDPVVYPWANLYNKIITPHEQILYNQYRGLVSSGQASASLDSLASINNLQQVRDLWFRDAFTTNHTLSASGGNAVYSFYGSLGYTDVQSNRPGETNNTYKVNLSQTLHAGQNVTLSLDAALVDKVSSGNIYTGMNAYDNTFLPYQLFKDPAGNPLSMNYVVGYSDSLRNNYQARSRINLDYVPLQDVRYSQKKTNNLSVNLIANATVKLWKDLSFRGTYGYLTAPGTFSTYYDARSLSQRRQALQLTVAPTTSSTPIYYYPTTGGLYSTTANAQQNWTIRNQLVYSTSIRHDQDRLTLQAGQEAQEQFSSASASNIPGYDRTLNSYPLLDYSRLSQGIPGTVTSGGGLFAGSVYYFGSPYSYSETRARTTSYFALGSYSLDRRYDLDLSWRQDHSNLFGHNVSTQNKPIWSFGAKWHISKERFMLPVKAINDLALRATYGITGNSPYVGAATLFDILAIQPGYQQGSLSGDAAYIQQAANNKLSWETTQTLNLGLDYALLDQRLTGAIDVYRKKTSNLINIQPLNPLTGFQTTTSNLGTLSNKGIELTVRSINLRTRNFRWTTTFLFSYNYNKLESYGKPNAIQNTVNVRLFTNYVAGYSMFPIFAYRYAGLDNMGDPLVKLNDKTVTKAVNGVALQDLRYMGTAQPPVNGSLSNTFTFKGFSLSGNMIYNIGAVMRRYNIDNFFYGRQTLNRPNSGTTTMVNLPAEFANRWKQPGDEMKTNIPSYVPDATTNTLRRNTNYYTSGDLNVVSASYAKLRDVTLSYAFKPAALAAIKANALSIYVQATNFMLWRANHYGIDPEFQNVSYLYYRHSYVLGANLSF